MKKFAFTLAETLIVMGIIGVIAALTLPNLNSSTGEKEKVAKFNKLKVNIEDAVGRAQAVYGPLDEWCSSSYISYNDCNKRHFDRITEFLKFSKICNSISVCTIPVDQNGSGGTEQCPLAAILADGSTFAYIGYYNQKSVESIYIDIDGPNKGANKTGHDVFMFEYSQQDGIVDSSKVYGTGYISDSKRVEKYPCGAFNRYDATDWVLLFNNMDYLKTTDGTTCPDGKTKLTFGGNHSCK